MASHQSEDSALRNLVDWLHIHHTRLLKFGAVGFSGVFVNLAVFNVAYYAVFDGLLSGDPRFVLANAAGFVVSVFTNFLLNDFWTWGDRRKGGLRHWFERLTKFYITASGAGAVQLLTAWISLTVVWVPLDPMPLGYKLAPSLGVLTGIGCGMVINFTASHLWAFRDASSSREH